MQLMSTSLLAPSKFAFACTLIACAAPAQSVPAISPMPHARDGNARQPTAEDVAEAKRWSMSDCVGEHLRKPQPRRETLERVVGSFSVDANGDFWLRGDRTTRVVFRSDAIPSECVDATGGVLVAIEGVLTDDKQTLLRAALVELRP
jgi:hypothetical protein